MGTESKFTKATYNSFERSSILTKYPKDPLPIITPTWGRGIELINMAKNNKKQGSKKSAGSEKHPRRKSYEIAHNAFGESAAPKSPLPEEAELPPNARESQSEPSDTRRSSCASTSDSGLSLNYLPKFVCICRSLEHCGKIATIHQPDCDFCTGAVSCPDTGVHRLYPVDKGWSRLRNQIERCREAAGLDPLVPAENEVFFTDYRKKRLGLPAHREPFMRRYEASYPHVHV